MWEDPTLQTNRFELKYLIDEQRASAVRGFVLGHLNPDPFMDPMSPAGYMVYSAYLDSPSLQLCRATIDGEKNRFKLRVRYYNGDPATPVFLEIKRRVNDSIIKSRAAVHRRVLPELISGRAPHESDLTNPGKPGAMAAMGKFCELRKELNAQPVTLVAYQREAYSSQGDGSARVTIDRHLRGADWSNDFTDLDGPHWHRTAVTGVILELKFTHRFPQWMTYLVRRFNLQRQSVPKYVHCSWAVRSPKFMALGTPGRIAVNVE